MLVRCRNQFTAERERHFDQPSEEVLHDQLHEHLARCGLSVFAMPIENSGPCFSRCLVISPRLAGYFEKKGYSVLPMDAVDYIAMLINDVLARRREHVERRNDFIQMMVDREEDVKNEEKTTQPMETNREHGTIIKKSTSSELRDRCLSIF